MSRIERLRKRLAVAAITVLGLLFLAMVVVGIFFSDQAFGLFVGLIIGTTMFAVFMYVILMFLKMRERQELPDDKE